MASKRGSDERRRGGGARMVGASLFWLGALVWVEGTAYVWLIMFGVYVLALGLSILIAPAFRTLTAWIAPSPVYSDSISAAAASL